MNPYLEIARLKKYIADLERRIVEKDVDARTREIKLLEARQQIETLEARVKFFQDATNDALSDVQYFRDRLNKNPYSDDFYNDH